MSRPLTLLAVFAALAAACSKNKPDGTPDGGSDGTAYTIKFRDDRPGDKVAVVKTRGGTNTTTIGPKSQTVREEQRYEYTETVHEVSPDSPRPTRLTREYSTARKTDAKGDLKALSYNGKTVEVKKLGKKGGYAFTVDGKALPPAEAADLAKEFDKAAGERFEEAVLPKAPVKVGETWAVDFGALKALSGDLPFPLDPQRSSITGRLARAYQKDGQQWGVMEFAIRMEVVPGGKGPPLTGTITADATLDVPIDGSANAGVIKVTMKGELVVKDAKAGDVKVVFDGVQEQTLTPVK